MRPDEIIRRILEIRGIASEEDVREFLSDRPKLTHDPILMPGIKEGAEFLFRAVSEGKRICVYGDYDVDGVLGTAALVLFLQSAARSLGSLSEITYYIPSRLEEGYGLNEGAIRAIKGEGADVIVTVDCGSVSRDEASYAREIGLDILITDHHEPDPLRRPDCIFINPKAETEGAGYPFRLLSGAGVAFKLCAAIMTLIGGEDRAFLHELVDLVCVATIADVMPLTDENRTFVKYGLAKLRKGARPAFLALLSVAGVDPGKLSARDVAFVMAPRLNALGRLGSASEAVEFILTDSEDRTKEIAERMERLNTERRQIQEDCFRECMELVNAGACSEEGGKGAGVLLLKPENSHEGVAGIVAGKVRDATGLPCAVLTEVKDNNGLLKGSARSRARFDITALLRRHGELFERLGGHAAAAGFTIEEKNLERLRDALTEDMTKMIEDDPGLLDDREEAELEIGVADVSEELAEAIETLAPFGAGNPVPSIAICVPAEELSGVRAMGHDGKHLRFAASGIPCVFFGGGGTEFPGSGAVRLTGRPEINEWNGTRNIQFAVEYIDVLQ